MRNNQQADLIKTVQEAEIATLRLPTHSEHCITVQRGGDLNQRIQSAAQKQNAVILSQFVFAASPPDAGSAAKSESSQWPVVWLHSDAQTDSGPYSVQAVALSGIRPTPVRSGERIFGFVYEDAVARYCRLCGLLPADRTGSHTAQTRSVFETAAALLARHQFRTIEIVRTWIFLDSLLEWYEDFNAVRTEFFSKAGIIGRTIPASTGIGARNPLRAAITMDVFAVQPKSADLTVKAVESPLQNPPMDYGSAFSRAIEIGSPTHRSLLLSGTASITREGKTLHAEDPEKQIRFTMDVVRALLESRGMRWNDLVRGIAYFKDMDLLPLFRRVAAELKIPPFPLAVAQASICRPDLFFEIELDAVQV
jgi:enamine deaminase RidA (YjgF/YER057c/UK114 family)